MAKLLILLASHKGSAFLEQQINSIRSQTFTDWHLLIRNDGKDSIAQALVAQLAAFDARIEWLPEASSEPLGACGNFGRLLSLARQRHFAYFALADQDDVWATDKLELQLKTLQQRELQVGASVPLLLHSDLQVVDAGLATIAASFVQMRQLAPLPTLANLLARNSVTGCTCLGNRSLLQLAVPLPACVVVHDWWLALCALGGGELLYLDTATVFYRQHMHNTIGAGFGFDRLSLRLQRARAGFRASFAQAQELARRLPASAQAQPTLTCYANLLSLPLWPRYRSYRQMRIWRSGPVARLQYVLQLLTA